MNNFDKLLNEIKKDIFNEDCVKQYFYYKNIIENNEELKIIEEEMKFHQKEMCKNKENSEIFNYEKARYEELEAQFKTNPILINYQNAKEEVYSFLVDIKEILG